MPAEHLNSPSPERSEHAKTELEVARNEQLDKILETSAENDPQKQAENQSERADAARKIIDREPKEPKAQTETESAPPPSQPLAFLDHHLNYTQTVASIQRKLKPMSRTFSKVIHTPVIEKTSEALETTVARPSVVLGATWTALIVGSLFYLTAHHYGYALSGSELLFSFVVGALLGLIGEGLWRGFKKRS